MYKHENGSILQLKAPMYSSHGMEAQVGKLAFGGFTTPTAATAAASLPQGDHGGGGLEAMEKWLEPMAETIITAAASKTLDLAQKLSEQSTTTGGIASNPTKGAKILEGEELYTQS